MSLLQNFCFVTKDSIYFERSCNSLHLDSPSTKSKDQGLWHSRLWSFQGRDTKLERFLAKNQLHLNEITKF